MPPSFLGAVMGNKSATKTPVPLVGRSAGAFSGWRRQQGTTQTLAAMEAASVVFGIVDRLATSVSLVDWRLWRKAKSGKPEDRVEVTSHLALDILNSPNEFYSRQELMEAAQQHQELTGESWLVVGRDPRARTIPLELWPVRPDRMEPVPSADSFLAGYEYQSPDGERVPLEKDDVLFVRRPDPTNPYRGLGPIRSVLTDIDSIRYSMEWNRNFFMNSAEPGGIVEIDRRLSDDEFDELVSRWREQHQGTAQAHRVAILEQVKWVDRKYTMRDMQFTELRGVTEGGIKLAFGFPKFALGELDDVNRAQGEASIAMYAKWLIVPRLERWKGVFNRRFLPMFGSTGQGLEFDYVSPVSEDNEAENAARTSKVGAVGVLVPLGFKPKETLAAFGLPDIPFEPPAPPAVPGAPGAVKPKPDPLQALLAPRFRNQAPTDDPELARVQADWEAALAALLAKWPAVTEAQRAEIRSQVEAAVEANDPAALARMSVSTLAGAGLLTAALVELATIAGQRMADELAAQGAPPVEPPPPDEGMLAELATAAVLLLAAGFVGVAAREAVRAFRTPAPGTGDVVPKLPGAPSGDLSVADVVDAALAALSDRALRDQLGGALTRAQNVARLETAKAADPDPNAPQIIYVGSETLDGNTCPPCRDVDEFVFPSWIEAWVAYAGGPYLWCKGGVRCRGTVRARWNPEAGQ